MVLPVVVCAVARRRRWPANAPCPKNAPAVRVLTRAARPWRDVVVNVTRPVWMYMTLLQESPWVKMVSNGLKRTLVLATCITSSSLLVFGPVARVFAIIWYPTPLSEGRWRES